MARLPSQLLPLPWTWRLEIRVPTATQRPLHDAWAFHGIPGATGQTNFLAIIMIYFSFGMHKAGSTLGFELTKGMFSRAGAAQILLPRAIIGDNQDINFLRCPTAENVRALEREVTRIGHPIVIKTHQAAIPEIIALLETGKAMGQCVYRDPRDIILSLLDAGTKAREQGQAAFSKIDSMERAIVNVEKNIRTMETWVHLPNILPVNYRDLAFDTAATVERLMRQTGVVVDASRLAREFNVNQSGFWPPLRGLFKKKPFTQFNKGIRDRYKTELTAEQNEMLMAKFGDFIERHCA